MPTTDESGMHRLEIEVEAELEVVQSSRAGGTPDAVESDWLFDPGDVEREEIGLRNLLDAVEVVESDSQVDAAIRWLPETGPGDPR